MKISMIVLKFLFIGALFIISNQNLHISVDDERDQFYQNYQAWLSEIFDNAKQITGYVINSEWLPSNKNVLLPEEIDSTD